MNGKIVIWEIIEKKKGFEWKNANDCGTKPRLLPQNIALGDLVDPID